VEFNGDEDDVIVVIPTTNVNGKFAVNCREDIFKGMHIIFVESGEGNFYFNYAHNCNEGLRRAIEYEPRWIVLSNDDMFKIDPPEFLINELKRIDDSFKIIFTGVSEYHSFNACIVKDDFLTRNLKFIIDFSIWFLRHNMRKLKLILTLKLISLRYMRFLEYGIKVPPDILR
jgi:hypothetical protein